MRITYVLLNAYAVGGTIRTVFNQAGALARSGHDVDIISANRHRETPQFELHPRVGLSSLVDFGPRRRWWRRCVQPRPGSQVPEREARKASFTREVERSVAAAFRDIDTDVLVTTRPGLNLFSAWYAPSNVTRVAQEHSHLKRHRGDLREAIDAAYPSLDAIVTLTKTDRARYRKAFADGPRIERIPNALHSLDVTQSNLDSKTVVAAGRLSSVKGFDLLVPAFAEVVRHCPDWRLHIFGQGPARDDLVRLIEAHDLGKHVFLKGQTKQLAVEMAQAAMFVLSSRSEGFPMALLEALSHGLPVVSFACHGAGEMVTDGQNGLLVPRGDTGSLGAAMRRIAEDRSLRERMGRSARQTAMRYGPGTVTRAWESLFTGLRSGASLAA